MSEKPENYLNLVQSKKSLMSHPQWDQITERNRFSFTTPLSLDSEVPEGLQLRGAAQKNKPDRAIIFQLEIVEISRKQIQLEMICWRSLSDHQNPAKGPLPYQRLNAGQTHHHPFELNFIASEGRMMRKNLPIAIPIEQEINDLNALLSCVGDKFNIDNMSLVVPPPYELDLFK